MWPSTCFSVSLTKPRLMRSPATAAAAPMAKEPAYQRGPSTLGREPSSRSRCFTPSEVIGLLTSGLQQHLADFGALREGRLPVVERLRGDLASMVDPHQVRGLASFGLREARFGQIRARHGSGGHWRSEHRAESPIEAGQQIVEGLLHGMAHLSVVVTAGEVSALGSDGKNVVRYRAKAGSLPRVGQTELQGGFCKDGAAHVHSRAFFGTCGTPPFGAPAAVGELGT
jgi:hypothetical protein